MTKITNKEIQQVCELKSQGMKHRDISQSVFGVRTRASTVHSILSKHYYVQEKKAESTHVGAKILTLDIETSPVLGAVWGLWNQNLGLNMIVEDWYVLSWAAKWAHKEEVMYQDIREHFDGSAQSLIGTGDKDKEILEAMWDLLDEADIIVTQNGIKFDQKKLFARFLHHGMTPPSSFKHIDTLQIAKKHFAFTSNKLEYMTDKFCTKYKKKTHAKFAGYTLWQQCLLGNAEAWDEMEEYNIYDVLSLEELVWKLAPWAKGLPNLDMYHDGEHNQCYCGASEWEQDGYAYTNLSKFTKFRCASCGAERRDRVNVLPKSKRQSLKMNVI